MYRLNGESSVTRLSDGAGIPFVNGNKDYEEYKQWLAGGGVPDPQFTPEQIAINAYQSKWAQINTQIGALTVTISANGHKYAANKIAMNEINIKISSLVGTETFMWYESWGSFMTNKVELQEVVALACQAEQAIIDSIMGV